MIKKILFTITFILTISHISLSQEELTITTYYPSPYGSYRELRSQRVAIGSNYINRINACWDDPMGSCEAGMALTSSQADLIIEGSVGIGLVNPQAQLHLRHNLTAGDISAAGNEIIRLQGAYTHAIPGSGPSINFVDDSSTITGRIRSYHQSNASQIGMLFQTVTDSPTVHTLVNNLFLAHNGNVGIGTISPTRKLHIESPTSGAIRIVDGTQADGRVLTSDANGVGTWQEFGGTIICREEVNPNNGITTCNSVCADLPSPWAGSACVAAAEKASFGGYSRGCNWVSDVRGCRCCKNF